MDLMLTPRRSGKTTSLIYRSAQTGYYIVCVHSKEASRIQVKATEMGLSIPFPITFREFINNEYNPVDIKGFLIDNAELLLQKMTLVKIDTITMSYNG